MPKKKMTYVPPFLHVSVACEGKLMYNMLVREATMPTAAKLDAFVKVDNSCDRHALAATLLECCATLYRDEKHLRDAFQDAAMRVSMLDLPMSPGLNDNKFPF